jgi:predicted O-methyltransferase YrrM
MQFPPDLPSNSSGSQEAPSRSRTAITLDELGAGFERFRLDLQRVRAYQAKLYAARGPYRSEYLLGRAIQTRWSEVAAVQSLWGSFELLARKLRYGRSLSPAFDDLESEILYLLLRIEQPEVVVEISPSGGWSTSWILHALRDNGHGHLHSFDIVSDSTRNLPSDLTSGRWTFSQGDVRTSSKIPDRIDFLFLDSDHTAEFADWYIGMLIRRLPPYVVVVIDDIFSQGRRKDLTPTEASRVLDFLHQERIVYLTVSPRRDHQSYETVRRFWRSSGGNAPIHWSEANPAIYFRWGVASEP